MSSTEGRQSPPPEGQTGAQLKDVPASGHGTDEAPDKQNKLQDQLKVRGSSRQPHFRPLLSNPARSNPYPCVCVCVRDANAKLPTEPDLESQGPHR